MVRRSRFALLALPLLIAGLVLVACGDDDGGGASPTQAPAATQAPASSPTSAAGGAANNISIQNFAYNPGRFNARAGQSLRLTVANQDTSPHTFTIDGVADSGRLNAGDSKVIEFTPSQAGTLTYYCTIHGAARMSGQVMVAGATGSAPPAPPAGSTTSGANDTSAATPSSDTDYGY